MDVDKEEETLSAMTVSQVKQWLEDVAGGLFKFLAPKNHRSGELLVLLTVDQCCDWCENQGGSRDIGVDLFNVIQKAHSSKAHSQPAPAAVANLEVCGHCGGMFERSRLEHHLATHHLVSKEYPLGVVRFVELNSLDSWPSLFAPDKLWNLNKWGTQTPLATSPQPSYL